jgi:hypothetical protein
MNDFIIDLILSMEKEVNVETMTTKDIMCNNILLSAMEIKRCLYIIGYDKREFNYMVTSLGGKVEILFYDTYADIDNDIKSHTVHHNRRVTQAGIYNKRILSRNIDILDYIWRWFDSAMIFDSDKTYDDIYKWIIQDMRREWKVPKFKNDVNPVLNFLVENYPIQKVDIPKLDWDLSGFTFDFNKEDFD